MPVMTHTPLTDGSAAPSSPAPRRAIRQRTRGRRHGPITRLMSPSDLGQTLKPFVFLDLFDAQGPLLQSMGAMPLHPHSGVATVTVPTQGRFRYDDPQAGSGSIGYAGVEWMRAGGGVWHGQEMAPEAVPRIQGFQLWLALPESLELAEPHNRYLPVTDMPHTGPAHVIVGAYAGVASPVPAPQGVNYLLVTLPAGSAWTYQPPPGHSVAWLALAQGSLDAGAAVAAGEMVAFEPGEASIALRSTGSEDAVFVLGSAVPHPHPLVLGNYSVHTSPQALESGERRIRELAHQMQRAGDRQTASGTVPVFR